MARLRDVPVVIRTVGAWAFLKRIVSEILDDNLFTMAGGLAYAWLFAIFPFLIFLLNVFPALVRAVGGSVDDSARGIKVFLFKLLPDPAAEMLWMHMNAQIIKVAKDPSRSTAFFSLIIALWAASKGIGVTMAAMERCYELERGRAFYTRRPMAFGLTLMVTGMVFLLVLLLPAGAAFKNWVITQSADVNYYSTWAFDIIRGGLAIAVVLLILAVLYHFGPSVKHRWNFLTPGAVFVLLMWIAVGLAFRYYVNHYGRSKYEETYGAVGGAAILLLLFYLDALMLLIGAEINSEIDFDILKVPRGTRNFRIAERRADAAHHAPASGPAAIEETAGVEEPACAQGAD
jgi:membrane protein